MYLEEGTSDMKRLCICRPLQVMAVNFPGNTVIVHIRRLAFEVWRLRHLATHFHRTSLTINNNIEQWPPLDVLATIRCATRTVKTSS